eukprot:COSAG01_NODE_2842_length_6990_cov_10.019301_9_plen_153_part_00
MSLTWIDWQCERRHDLFELGFGGQVRATARYVHFARARSHSCALSELCSKVDAAEVRVSPQLTDSWQLAGAGGLSGGVGRHRRSRAAELENAGPGSRYIVASQLVGAAASWKPARGAQILEGEAGAAQVQKLQHSLDRKGRAYAPLLLWRSA